MNEALQWLLIVLLIGWVAVLTAHAFDVRDVINNLRDFVMRERK